MKTLINAGFIVILFIFCQSAFSQTAYSVLYTHHLDPNDRDDPVPIGDLSPQHSRQILSEDGKSLYGHTATTIYKLDFALPQPPIWTTLLDIDKTINNKYIIYGDLILSKDKSQIYGIKQSIVNNNNPAQVFAINLSNNESPQIIHEFPSGERLVPVGIALSPDGHYLYGIARAKEGICEFPEICKRPKYKHPSVLYRVILDNSTQQNFTILHTFAADEDGEQPNGKLAITADGRVIYGTTKQGGAKSAGTIFKVNLDETENPHVETLYAFQGFNEAGSGMDGEPDDIILSKDEQYLYGTVAPFLGEEAGYIYQFKLSSGDTSFKVFDFFRDSNNEMRTHPGDLLLSKDGNQLLGKTSQSITGNGQHSVLGNGIVFKISLNTPKPMLTELCSTKDGALSLVSNREGNTLFWGYYEDYFGSNDRSFSIAQLKI